MDPISLIHCVNLSVLTTGMSLAWPSPMLVKLVDPAQTPLARPITTEEGSWLVSLGFLISIFSSVPIGYLADAIGRKCTLLLTTIPKLVGCLLILFAAEVWVLILARTIMMVADCLVFVVVPVYASEIASKEHRSILGTFLQVFCSVGLVITFTVGPFVSFGTYNTVFLCMIAAAGLPLLFLPDSPYHQYSKGKISEAINSLKVLRGSEEAAKIEIEEYSKSKNDTKIDKVDLLRNKLFLKSLAIAVLVSGGSQLIGFNAVSYYMQTILESAQTSVRSEIGSVIVGVIQLTASFCTIWISNRFGRRSVLIGSFGGVMAGLLGLGAFFQVSQVPGYEVHGFMNYLPTVSLVVMVFCFSAGVGSLNWIIAAEIFEGPSRAFGVSIALTFTITVIFISAKYFAALTSTIGAAATYWLFSVNCAIILTLIFLFVPETKGKSFSEIQKLLMNRHFYFREEKLEKVDLGNA